MPVTVSIDLHKRTVFLAGEDIECYVTFQNDDTSQFSNTPITLAWASVQMHCQCVLSESRIKITRPNSITTEDASTTGCNTSFVPNKGENGVTILTTKPQVLFCDLKLFPGQSKTFNYSDVLPRDCPPSYKGQAIKYSYKLTVGAQRLGHPTRIVRLPFRVLVLYGLNDLSVYTEPDEIVAPTNPFLKHKPTEHSLLDVAMQVLATLTARKGPYTYNITNAHGSVGKLTLFKLAYKLGEDIIGVFDFSNSTTSCVQYCVSLESEEQISEEHRQSSYDSPAVTCYSKHQEMCLHLDQTHFCIPVPLTATPAFITDIVCLRWRLHFEFTTSADALPPHRLSDRPDEVSVWQGPAELNVETMVWNLGIKVFPTNPIHVSELVNTTNSINV